MVLQNNIILQDGVPARLHITDHRIERRTITDPTTLGSVIRNTLVLNVDRLDGRAVEAVLSTMAEKLALLFEPYLKDKSYRSYEVIITQKGEGFQRRWTVQFIPFATR
jgi:hypothetical protein